MGGNAFVAWRDVEILWRKHNAESGTSGSRRRAGGRLDLRAVTMGWVVVGLGRAACESRVMGKQDAVIEIGVSLTQARMRLGIDIAEAARETRLREYYLRALETEEFDQLPPGSYGRAFLRTYAAFLDLDAELLVEEYVTRFEPRESRNTAVPPPSPAKRSGRRRHS